MYLLLLTSLTTGCVHVESFASRFDRALEIIRQAKEPVTVQVADYA